MIAILSLAHAVDCTYLGISPTDLSNPAGCNASTPRHVRGMTTYRIGTNIHPADRPAVQQGMAAWNGGPGTKNPGVNVDFRYAGTTLSVSSTDDKFTVSSVSPTWLGNNGALQSDFALTLRAFRGPSHSSAPCALKGADILLNNGFMNAWDAVSTLVTVEDLLPTAPDASCSPSNPQWPGCVIALPTLVAHELGHVLGLAHNEPHRLMGHYYPFGSDVGLGEPSPSGSDYYCIRMAKENLDTHPALEWVYRAASLEKGADPFPT